MPTKTELKKLPHDILVVGDDTEHLELMAYVLTQQDCRLRTAATWRLALQAMAEKAPDLIFLSLSGKMWEVDGYGTTQRIRAWESQQARTGTPIIALGDHMPDGEKEKYLAAGVDDFLSKPLDKQQLYGILNKWVVGRKGPPDAFCELKNPERENDPEEAGVIDIQMALARIGGLTNLYRKLLKRFVSTYAEAPEGIMASLASGEYQVAKRTAHTIKSLAGQIGAAALSNASADLEKTIGPQPEEVEKSLRHFRKEFYAATKAIKELLETGLDAYQETNH